MKAQVVKSLVDKTVSNVAGTELMSRDYIVTVNEYFTGMKKDKREEALKDLNKYVVEATESTSIQGVLKRYNTTAMHMINLGVRLNYEAIEEASVITKVVSLVTFINKQYEDNKEVLTDVRTTLNGVYNTDMSPYRYGNTLMDTVKALRTKYKVIVDDEGTHSVKPTYVTVLNMVHLLSDEDRNKLLAELIKEGNAEKVA